MCRLLAYAGDGDDLPRYLLGEGATLASLACEHGDGWGLAAWPGPHASAWVAKAPENAEKDPEFGRAAALRAPRLLAHIRRASAGGVAFANTHPFARGRWAFAHNGTIRGLDAAAELAKVDGDLRKYRAGETDSEVAFLLFLGALRRRGGFDAPLETAAEALAEVAADLRARYAGTADKPTKLNFVAGNGDGFVATRWIHDLSYRAKNGTAAVASVPLGPAEGWAEVPDASVVVVRPGRVDIRGF